MKGRDFTSDKYRYGFNGMEKDDEVKGESNSYGTDFRLYDPRLGRWLTLDPVIKIWESPYVSSHNNPIKFCDKNGDDPTGDKYKVKKGDTFWALAKKSGGKYTVQDLISWNKGADPKKLKVGQLVNISDPSKGMLLGTSGKVGVGDDAETGGDKTGTGGQDPTTDKGKQMMEKYKTDYTHPNDAVSHYVNANKNASAADLLISNPFVGNDINKSVKRFLDGAGGTFNDYAEATSAFMKSGIFSKIKSQVQQNFQTAIQGITGDLSQLSMSPSQIPSPPSVGVISYSMAALFGGTQQLDIYLMDITVNADNSYTAIMRMNIWDDYGVSTADFTKERGWLQNIGGAQLGLQGMWLLQHQYGRKPLINGLSIKFTINGKY